MLPPSLILLTERLTALFERQGHRPPLILTRHLRAKHQPVFGAEIVVLSEALPLVLDPAFWRHAPARVWTLSESVAKLLRAALNPETAQLVKVISRNDLFKPARCLYPLEKSDRFVYAGRDVAGKNVELLCELVAKLRRNGFSNHELFLLSPSPNQGLYANRKWIHVLGDHGLNWAEKIKGSPAFVSLSHYAFEDFSVAAAQAQERGWPLIVPRWQAFNDISGDGVMKLTAAPETLLHRFESKEIIQGWSSEILHQHPSSKSINKIKSASTSVPIAAQIATYFSQPRKWTTLTNVSSVVGILSGHEASQTPKTKRSQRPAVIEPRFLKTRYRISDRAKVHRSKNFPDELKILHLDDFTMFILTGILAELFLCLHPLVRVGDALRILDPRALNKAVNVKRLKEGLSRLKKAGIIVECRFPKPSPS